MKDIYSRLEELKTTLSKPSFLENKGRANEVNYWVFDYDPKDELKVREWTKSFIEKNNKHNHKFQIVEYDLYDFLIDQLEEEGFIEACKRFEESHGFERITRAIGNLVQVNDQENLIVKHIVENTPNNSIVFLTGIGKCYPILRSHKILNNLSQSFNKAPVVLFFPGLYDEQSLRLFNSIKDDNYYRAFKLVK